MDREEVAHIPIQKVGKVLIASLPRELTDKMVRTIGEDVLKKIKAIKPDGLIIDVSGLAIIDSFVGRSLINIARMAKLMDTPTIITGISPEIAIILMQMGFRWVKVTTAVDIDHGLEKLNKLKAMEKKVKRRW
ncbi:MAG: STAS domain-containing protein [bacterium]